MAEVLLSIEEQIESVEQAFLALAEEIEEVGAVKDYRPAPDEPIENDVVCIYFDWEDEEAHTTRGARAPTTIAWTWMVDIYVHGYEARDMQKRMRAIILKLREKLRENRTLGRGEDGRSIAKNGVALTNVAPPVPITVQSSPGYVKRFRMTAGRQV